MSDSFYNTDLYVPYEDYKKIMTTMVYDKFENKSYTIRDYCKKTKLDEQLVAAVLNNNTKYEPATLLRSLLKSNRVASIRLGNMVNYNLSLSNEIKTLAMRQEALEDAKKKLDDKPNVDSAEYEKLKEENKNLSQQLAEQTQKSDEYFKKLNEEKEYSDTLLKEMLRLNKSVEKSEESLCKREKILEENKKKFREEEQMFKEEVKRFTYIVRKFKNS